MPPIPAAQLNTASTLHPFSSYYSCQSFGGTAGTLDAYQLTTTHNKLDSLQWTRSMDPQFFGAPASDPEDGKLETLQTSNFLVTSQSSYGGPWTKYTTKRNDDSYGFGVTETGVFAVISDGPGSQEEEAAAISATTVESLIAEWRRMSADATYCRTPQNKLMSMIFKMATQNILAAHGKTAFATALMVAINTNLKTTIGCCGDSKAMTLRNGRRLEEGTTTIQNGGMCTDFDDLDSAREAHRELEPALRDRYGIIQFEDRRTHQIRYLVFSPENLANGDYYKSRFTSQLTRSLCQNFLAGRESGPETLSFQAEVGDVIIMGCDGFWNLVSEYEVEMLAQQFKGEELQKTLFLLAYMRNNATVYEIEIATGIFITRQRGKPGGDNLTLQVLTVLKPE